MTPIYLRNLTIAELMFAIHEHEYARELRDSIRLETVGDYNILYREVKDEHSSSPAA